MPSTTSCVGPEAKQETNEYNNELVGQLIMSSTLIFNLEQLTGKFTTKVYN